MTWTIKTWNRSLARGSISSPHVGELPFDASAALVDDFAIGESIEVDLEPAGESYRVLRIWPDDPRFMPPGDRRADAPLLRPDLARRLDELLARVPVQLDYRVASMSDELVVEGDDDHFAYGHSDELRFRGIQYAEIPTSWNGKSFRLANAAERGYLNTRVILTSESVGVRIVDDERRIYFVVCRDVEWRAVGAG